MKALDIGILGAGTAGPAAAILLGRAGHRVTLYERVPRPGPVGAGIVLQPSGMSALATLGLLEPVLLRGAVLDELYAETPRRRRVVHLRYADLAPDLYGLGLHRGVLFETLFGAMLATPGVTARLGVEVRDLGRAADGRNLIVDTDGATHGPHDLVVVADGAKSRLRDDAALGKRVRRYPWGALWFVADDRERVLHGTRRLYQVVDGTRHLFGLLPTGLRPGTGPGVGLPAVSLFWSIRGDRVDEWRRGGPTGLDAWKARLEAYAPGARFVLDQIHSPDQLLFSEYHDVVMDRWHTDDVVYLGDAAHATSPQLGQGANLALVDACVLAECLHEHDQLPGALAEYGRRRRAHLGYYQFATRWLTPFFQSDLTWLGPVRDLLFGVTCRWPIIGRLMLTGMAGIARGPLRPSLKLAHRPPALESGGAGAVSDTPT